MQDCFFQVSVFSILSVSHEMDHLGSREMAGQLSKKAVFTGTAIKHLENVAIYNQAPSQSFTISYCDSL